MPPGIYGPGPGPPPIHLIRWPPGINIRGTLPNWPRITIRHDRRLTTEEQGDECQTQTAEACTTTTYVSASTMLSTETMCETILGCSISVSDSSTVVVGTQTAAPIGTWYDEGWVTMTLGEAYTNSVYSALSEELARDQASAGGTVISFTSGLTAGPTCAGGANTAYGGTLCSGYWCNPSPTRHPPGYQDPNDPNSGGYSAPTTGIGSSTSTSTRTRTTTTARICTVTDVCNCDDTRCDECSPSLLLQRHMPDPYVEYTNDDASRSVGRIQLRGMQDSF